MQIFLANHQYRACFTPKEIVTLLVSNFFNSLFSAQHLYKEPYDATVVSEHISYLADRSVNSKDYELYVAIQDLYYLFEKDCLFCFNLDRSFDAKRDSIASLGDLYKFRSDDWSDVIVLHRGKFLEFQLKRYRGEMMANKIFEFIRTKIINHYSGKENYLIILQPQRYSEITSDLFSDLHKLIKNESRDPGIVALLFNHASIEKLVVRVFPKLDQIKLPLDESEVFIELFQ